MKHRLYVITKKIVNINSFCVYRFGHLLHLNAFSFNDVFVEPLGELVPGLGYSALN